MDPEHGCVELLRLTETGYRLEVRHDRANTLRSPSFVEVAVALEPIFRPL